MSVFVKGTCASSSFRALLTAQFLGALNDNLFKLFIALLIVRDVLSQGSGVAHLVLINVCFVTPYVLFSTLAGGLADTYSKTVLLRLVKLFEVIVMLLAFFFLQREASYALLAVLFLMGTQSAFFSPNKYGILPELLEESSLSKGNGLLECLTFLGIIIGTGLAGGTLAVFDFSSNVPGTLLIIFSSLGFLSTLRIARLPAVAPATSIQYNPLHMLRAAADMRANRGLFLTVLAIGYFWSIAALYQLNLVLFARVEAGLGDLAVSLQLVCLGVGIGVGSIVAGKVSEGKVELGLVPLGAIGLAFWSILLSFLVQQPLLAAAVLFCIGFSTGFYIVPLNAYLQNNSPAQLRGKSIAACNFLSFGGMLLFSWVLMVSIDTIGLRPSQIFMLAGFSAIFVSIIICSVLPEVLLRCVNWLIIHLLYSIRIRGEEHIPTSGGALLVCNHVSMIDASLLLASVPRVVRFLMFKPYFENKLIHPFAKALGAIPIEAGGAGTSNALEGASDAIASGDIVGIFAEGAITRTGQLLRFRSGLERIMTPVNAPIIPVHLDQVWGSVFSFRNGRFFWKLPRRIPYPVTVTFGRPLAADASAVAVRQAVQELAADAYSERPSTRVTLFDAFMKAAKNNGLRPALYAGGLPVSYYRLLADALALASVLQRKLGKESAVFVRSERSRESVLLQLALQRCGICTVLLDDAVGDEARLRVQRSMSLRYLISVEHAPSFEGLETITVSELLSEIDVVTRWKCYLAAVLIPSWMLEGSKNEQSSEQAAAVVFSRGRSGSQKAVELSHRNIVSNCSAFEELFSFHNDDMIAGMLPHSHAMGYTATLWLPLLTGCRLSFEAGGGARRHSPSYFFCTTAQLETFLEDPGMLPALKHSAYVIVGGDTVTAQLRERFAQEAEGILLEGYGTAELAPLALINVPDVKQGKNSQAGTKSGMLGHPLPGVAVKVVDAKELTPLPVGAVGELWVRGPNVMRGYVGESPDGVLREGWLRTGDLVSLDADGFVEFHGRL